LPTSDHNFEKHKEVQIINPSTIGKWIFGIKLPFYLRFMIHSALRWEILYKQIKIKMENNYFLSKSPQEVMRKKKPFLSYMFMANTKYNALNIVKKIQ